MDPRDADLTKWEQLQIAAIAQILKTGKARIVSQDFDVVVDYTRPIK